MFAFRLLGQVGVAVDGDWLDAGRPHQRCVLAALLADAGRVVTTEQLIDRVWGQDAPDTARRNLHVHVARIRRLLAQVATEDRGPRLVAASGGYRLDVDREAVDLHRFRRLVGESRGESCAGPERLGLLRTATQLWRGQPLSGLSGPWVDRMRRSWRQEHIEALIAWASAETECGDATAVIGPLTEMLDEHPLVEPFAAALMTALEAAGRTSEALECYARTRRRLVEELGTEPGAAMRSVHERLLRRDTGSAREPVVPAGPRRSAAPPAQLPSDVQGFVGREPELAYLDDLADPARADGATAVLVTVITGTAGVGKTTLAVHWAHRVAHRFPDGLLYVNLRGFDPGGNVVDPASVVREFLDSLGVAPHRVPGRLDAQTALYRSVLSGRRVLLVLDNARDTEQVAPLIPGEPGCLVVITSRAQLTGLIATHGIRPVMLGLLSARESRHLLARRLGAPRIAAEPEAVNEIIKQCANLPLSLALIAAHAAVRPDTTMGTLAHGLRDADERWHALTGDGPGTDVRAAFSWSYRALTPPAARLFRLLGLHPGTDITAAACASLAAVPPVHARALLGEMAGAHLLTEHATGRYGMHDLLRAYAAELGVEVDPPGEREEALRRILDHYLHSAHAAARYLNRAREPIALAPAGPGTVAEEPPGEGGARAWLDRERSNLLAAIDRAAGSGHDVHAWQLAWAITSFLNIGGHWRDWAATQEVAVEALRRLDDRRWLAGAHRSLAAAHTLLANYPEAERQLRYARELAVEANDPAAEAHTHLGLSRTLVFQDRWSEALDEARRSLELFRRIDSRPGMARALNQVGHACAMLGRYRESARHCQQALDLYRELDEPHTEAAAWDSLAYAHQHLGDHDQALACYQRAHRLYRDLGDRYEDATTLTRLGDAHRDAGDEAAARDAWRGALALLVDLDHPDADDVRARLDTAISSGRAGVVAPPPPPGTG